MNRLQPGPSNIRKYTAIDGVESVEIPIKIIITLSTWSGPID